MPTVSAKTARNQAMECCKLIAAVFVVLIHVEFPGELNGYVLCLSHFSVPIFFTISGYFNFGADQETLLRRLKHILQLYVTAILVRLLLGCVFTELKGGSTVVFLRRFLPDLQEIGNWLIFQLDNRMAQLWYLASLCFCYWILRCYVRFFGDEPVDYRPLYFAGLSLFSVFFVFGMLAPAIGMEIPYPLYRNAYFMGLPFFTLGIFIHAYQERILKQFAFTTRKQLLWIGCGVLLGILQWKVIGIGQITVGALIEVFALMLFMISHPKLTGDTGVWNGLISKFGAWSTYIYLFHMIMLGVYLDFCASSVVAALREWEPYVRPFAVTVLSFLFAVLFERGAFLFREIRRYLNHSRG